MGAQRLAITNVVGSAITTLADAVIYQHSGPEIAVVASKSFTGQIAALLIVGLAVAQGRGALTADAEDALHALPTLSACVREALEITKDDAARVGERNANVDRLLFLGRGVGYPTALEGALKLKEISYIPTEAYSAGEMKHGPIALLDES